MSRGLSTNVIPTAVHRGARAAFKQWSAMTFIPKMGGEGLETAPEYFLTMHIADALQKAIPASKRTMLLEPSVKKTLASAGGISRGVKAKALRHSGRYDLVIGNTRGIPRVVMEVKCPLGSFTGAKKDFQRICHTLLTSAAENNNLYRGCFVFYCHANPPRKKDANAYERLVRKFENGWESKLKNWEWVRKASLREQWMLSLDVRFTFKRYDDSEGGAWASGCIMFTKRRTPRTLLRPEWE